MPDPHAWVVSVKGHPVAAYSDFAEAADAFSLYAPEQATLHRVEFDDLVMPDPSLAPASFIVGFDGGDPIDLMHAAASSPTDGNRWGERGYVTVEAANARDAMAKAVVLFEALGICQPI